MTRSSSADVLVVGLGAVGSAVAHHLARRGARVIGIDRFHPPHDRGSSHGATRITRLAIGEGIEFVPLVQRSHVLWRELERDTGTTLYTATGGVVIESPTARATEFHGRAGFFDRTVAAAARFGIGHEVIAPAEARRRFPAFLVRDDDRVYVEPEAGVLRPEACVGAQLTMARRHGATLRFGETVTQIETSPQGASVTTDAGRLSAAHVVLTAGPWIGALAGPAFASQLAVQRQVLHWFRTDEPALYVPGTMPIFIWQHGGRHASFYGFPMIDGTPGVKVAEEQVEHSCTADDVERRIDPAETAAMFEDHVRGRLRGAQAESVRATTCLYTSTRDGRFLIDRHPEHPAVTVVSACSGHGFKHSAGVGESVAQHVLGQATTVDLSPFALAGSLTEAL